MVSRSLEGDTGKVEAGVVVYIGYVMTLATVVGTVANSLGKRWCFLVWLCTNAFWCIHNIWIMQYAQALLYAFNFVMAIVGFVKWKKNYMKTGNERVRVSPLKRYESKYAVCPFYKSEDPMKIYCEGVEDGTSIHLAFFSSSIEKKQYCRRYCQSNYCDCLIAKALFSKYEE